MACCKYILNCPYYNFESPRCATPSPQDECIKAEVFLEGIAQ